MQSNTDPEETRIQPTDEDLVRAFQRGDDEAFNQFVLRHQDRVFRMAIVWLTSADSAADASQETFLRCYKGLTRFRFAASPLTWLMKILRNVCREQNRTLDRFHPSGQPLEEQGVPLQQDATGSDEPLKLAIRQLPEKQREVLVLRIFEELSVKETARITGTRPGTVKANLHKAIQNLKRSLQPKKSLNPNER